MDCYLLSPGHQPLLVGPGHRRREPPWVSWASGKGILGSGEREGDEGVVPGPHPWFQQLVIRQVWSGFWGPPTPMWFSPVAWLALVFQEGPVRATGGSCWELSLDCRALAGCCQVSLGEPGVGVHAAQLPGEGLLPAPHLPGPPFPGSDLAGGLQLWRRGSGFWGAGVGNGHVARIPACSFTQRSGVLDHAGHQW